VSVKMLKFVGSVLLCLALGVVCAALLLQLSERIRATKRSLESQCSSLRATGLFKRLQRETPHIYKPYSGPVDEHA
jgi:hypothetical protein